ncbi:MAG: hypothetical protein K8I60_14545 [Anaerolineae bacterium]|nr:hypothetical protein [Anaerolineae bacterium]
MKLSSKLFLITLAFVISLLGNAIYAQEIYPSPTFVDWNPNGLYQAVGFENEVRLIEVSTGQTIRTFPWSVSPQVQVSPQWSPDGNKLAIVNGSIEIWEQPWNLANTAPISQLPSVSTFSTISWSPDSSKLGAGSGSVVEIWNLQFPELERLINDQGISNILDLEWINADLMAVSSTLNLIVLINPNTGSVINYYSLTGEVPVPATYSIDSNPAGTQLVMGNGAGNVDIWTDFSLTDPLQQSQTKISVEMYTVVYDTEWNPVDNLIAILAGSNIHIWDYEANEIIEVVPTPGFVHSVDWSPDGTQLAYADETGDVEIIDVSDSCLAPTCLNAPIISPISDTTDTRYSHRWNARRHATIAQSGLYYAFYQAQKLD